MLLDLDTSGGVRKLTDGDGGEEAEIEEVCEVVEESRAKVKLTFRLKL